MIDKKNNFFTIALDFQYKNDFINALQNYDKVLALEEEHSLSWYNKGVIYLQCRDYSNAIKCFDKAIECDHTNALFWNNKGIVCLQAGLFFKANHCFTKSIQNDQTIAEFWLNKKIALEYIGKPDESQICYTKFKKYKEYLNSTNIRKITNCRFDSELIRNGKLNLEFPYVFKGQRNNGSVEFLNESEDTK